MTRIVLLTSKTLLNHIADYDGRTCAEKGTSRDDAGLILIVTTVSVTEQRRGRINLVLNLRLHELIRSTLRPKFSMDFARSVAAISHPSSPYRIYLTSCSILRTGIGFCLSSLFFAAIAESALERLFGFRQYACEPTRCSSCHTRECHGYMFSPE